MLGGVGGCTAGREKIAMGMVLYKDSAPRFLTVANYYDMVGLLDWAGVATPSQPASPPAMLTDSLRILVMHGQ